MISFDAMDMLMTVVLLLFRIQRTNVTMATGSKNCTRDQLYLPMNCVGRHVQHYANELSTIVCCWGGTLLAWSETNMALFPRVGDRVSYSSTGIFVLFSRDREPKRNFIRFSISFMGSVRARTTNAEKRMLVVRTHRSENVIQSSFLQ